MRQIIRGHLTNKNKNVWPNIQKKTKIRLQLQVRIKSNYDPKNKTDTEYLIVQVKYGNE